MIEKSNLIKEVHLEMTYMELDLMKFFKNNPHENIITPIDFFEDNNFIYFILEIMYCNLNTFINDYSSKLNENDGKEIIKQIGNGIEFLHDKGIIHRDMKPENILVKYKNDNKINVKIADYGLSIIIPKNKQLMNLVELYYLWLLKFYRKKFIIIKLMFGVMEL